MRLIFPAFLAFSVLAACSTNSPSPVDHSAYHKSEIISHPFEKRLYVANHRVPLLSQNEWAEIQSNFQTRKEYVFHDATRETEDLVRVCMAYKGDPPRGPHLYLVFERRGGHWIETKADEEETVFLIE